MSRLALAAASVATLLLALPGPAAAAPVPVADGVFLPSVALAGDRVAALELDGSGGTVVKVFPAAGGSGTRVAELGDDEGFGTLAAGTTRLAALVDGEVVAGTAGAPLRPVAAAPGVESIAYAGDTLLLATDTAVTTVAADGARGSWPMPRRADATHFTAAGPYAAVFVADTENPGVAVLDAATGTERYYAPTDLVRDLSLQDDGTLAVLDEGSSGRQDLAWHSLADPRPHSLPRPDGEVVSVRLAADRIVAAYVTRSLGDYAVLRLAGGPLTTGPRTPFGVPWLTEQPGLQEVAVRGTSAAISTDDCLVTLPVSDPVAPALPAGPCDRDQAAPAAVARTVRIGADRRVPVRVTCVAAAGPACRGTLRAVRRTGLGTVASVRYRVARGTTRTVHLVPTALGRRLRGRHTLSVNEVRSNRSVAFAVRAPSR